MGNVSNRKAKFVQALGFCEYGKEPMVFVSITNGTIAEESMGSYGWSWDKIFIPGGKNQTLACFEDEERLKLWNDTGYMQLAKYLKK